MLKRLTITFTEAERTALDQLAQQDTRPVKEQVRVLVVQEAQRRAMWPISIANLPADSKQVMINAR